MQRHNIVRWILAAWFMLLGCTASFGYTTSHNTSVYTNVYTTAAAPSYQFRSTSVYSSSFSNDNSTFVPLADDPYASPGPRKGPRKSSPWDEDPEKGGNELGVVDDPTPIGEPLVLLLLAALYGGYRLMKRKKVIS